ncbi:MAG: chemotaxis protein CheX [Kiritimatiellae bacterium]|nr:chemotaxis protein CheX [Kiritimatiellia bacterium]
MDHITRPATRRRTARPEKVVPMPSRFFGQYLMEKGIITREMFLEAVRQQSAIDLPLCSQAITGGLLTEEQVARLDQDGRRSALPPLEEAVRLGMLTFSQLEELGNACPQKHLLFAEALIRKGFLSLSQAARALAQYRADFPDQPAVNSALPADAAIPHRDIVRAVLQAFMSVLVHYTKQVVRVASLSTGPPERVDTPWVFGQRIVSEVPCDIFLAVPEALALTIAREMLHAETVSMDDLAVDAITEFLNVVVGTACGALSEAGLRAQAAPPEAISAERLCQRRPAAAVTLNLETTKGALLLLFAFPDQS